MARSKNQSKTVASKTRSTKGAVARRDFMKSAAVAGAALAPASVMGTQRTTGSHTAPRAGAVPIVTQRAETTPTSDGRVLTQDSSGSDFMIDVMMRDYVKWDDEPASLQHFAESAVRAYTIAMTAPTGPVVITVDAEMAERPIPEADQGHLYIPTLVRPTPPQGDRGAVREVARLLVEAEHPAMMADGTLTRTEEGRRAYLELQEILGSPRASTAQADVIFGD